MNFHIDGSEVLYKNPVPFHHAPVDHHLLRTIGPNTRLEEVVLFNASPHKVLCINLPFAILNALSTLGKLSIQFQGKVGIAFLVTILKALHHEHEHRVMQEAV